MNEIGKRLIKMDMAEAERRIAAACQVPINKLYGRTAHNSHIQGKVSDEIMRDLFTYFDTVPNLGRAADMVILDDPLEDSPALGSIRPTNALAQWELTQKYVLKWHGSRTGRWSAKNSQLANYAKGDILINKEVQRYGEFGAEAVAKPGEWPAFWTFTTVTKPTLLQRIKIMFGRKPKDRYDSRDEKITNLEYQLQDLNDRYKHVKDSLDALQKANQEKADRDMLTKLREDIAEHGKYKIVLQKSDSSGNAPMKYAVYLRTISFQERFGKEMGVDTRVGTYDVKGEAEAAVKELIAQEAATE